MSDTIIINNLHIETIIGLYPWEREVRQTLLVDLKLSTDIKNAAANDDLKHTINYEAVCQHTKSLAQNNQYKLIETLAENIATMILSDFGATAVGVTVKKCDNMTDVDFVGVSIERP